MKSRIIRLRPLASAVALITIAGLATNASFAGSPVGYIDGSKLGPDTRFVVHDLANASKPARYIVRFEEQPLALYNGSPKPVSGIAEIPMKKMPNGRTRLDVHSAAAQSYLAYLSDKHQQHLADIATAIGHAPKVRYQMKHALNAALVELSSADVAKVLKVPGVVAVERDRPHALATDIGPGFIGAASVWWGSPAGQDTIFTSGFESVTGYRGDGIVIGDIDTGYNSMSPSFQATDDAGYTVTNPLGTGNFLPASQCNVAGISLAGCNDKVIGVYDEIDLTNSDPSFSGQYSVEDVQGHGSHTGSTLGGDGRSATLAGYTAPISGVAPHANLVIYYACSPDPSIQCSTAATSASVDQAVADGVVDALNYSISGGTDPWNDSTSLAFLAAADAGLFIAAAAGNTSASVPNQVPGTANHLEPWVTTAAAGTHTGGAIGFNLTVNGAGAPGPVPLKPAAFGTGLGAAINAAPIIVSPTFNDIGGNDGCSAYTGGTFTGAIALLKYGGTCGTNTRSHNALLAGATDVVIVANTDGAFTSGANQTIPVWSTGLTIGTQLATYLGANPSSTVNVSYPATRLAAQPDVLAGFSLLGPANFDVIKPDVQAPGVDILAAVANDGSPNGPDLVALFDGTSMATPHTTGSGALMMGLHTGWTPMEAKSALMMTALENGLTKADGTTPSDFFDRGAGRLQDFPASKAGLVLNETGLNFTAANPATGGDPSKLNVPSMQSNNCVTVDITGTSSTASCSFTRLFRTTQNHTVTWTAAFTGVTATATPPTLSIHAGANPQPITVNVDASAYASDDTFHFGEMTLTADDASLPVLHLPIAVKILPPAIAVAPTSLSITIPPPKTTKDGTLTVSNTGGPTLNVTNTNDNTTASTKFVIIDQPSEGNNAYYATFFTDAGSGSYATDDFVVPFNGTNLSAVVIPGFTLGTSLAGLAGNGVHFQIYNNAAGLPDGGPEGLGNAPVYTYDTTIGATGLDVTGDTISLDFVAAGAPATNLPAGTYWLVVFVDIDSTVSAYAQFVTTVGHGSTGAEYGPVFGETNWSAITDFPGFAMHIEEQVPCGAAWLSTAPPTLTLGGLLSGQVTVTADSTQFPVPGAGSSADAFLCIDSNDANNPIVAVPVHAHQM